ncbi:DUF4192 family protein [Microbacterium sp. No. 7]|uniref:DUF4192 family protein n=1 Tax=Microbacterium sp. No. 7 TaxID=1714373 RepID=UPI0006CF4802|nr:DUF4192 family protein [Microbacterium sp. No. 7]ALJ22005.1 hypothetical protein AOA12_19750 [Microbacterium sp. No. 7]
MTTITRAADAAHLLSLVPRLLEYTPRRSLVLIPLERGRSVGAMRLDLPPDAGPRDETVERVASTVIGMVCRIPHADAFVAVAYTDDAAGPELPHRGLADALALRADACGLRMVDALTVAANGWGSHLDPAGAIEPLDAVRQSALQNGDAEDPAEVRGDQTTGAELPATTPERRREVAGVRAELERAIEVVRDVEAPASDGSGPITAAALTAVCALADLPALYEDALRWDAGALSPLHAGLLSWCLDRPALRDVALMQWSGDRRLGEEAAAAQSAWEEGGEYPVSLAERLWGEGPQPDPERLARALALVRQVAALVPDSAGALAVCAWLSWAQCRSTHADGYVRRACEIDAEHGLAQIVGSFIAAAHLPDWGFRRFS